MKPSTIKNQKKLLTKQFNDKSGLKQKPAKKSRPTPVSVRFSDEEREQLKKDAEGQSLNSYIKSRVFDEAIPRKRKYNANPVTDMQLLAQTLSALGQTEVFKNLNTIIEQLENGTLVLTPETEEQINVACLCVINMRNDLIKALGLRPDKKK
jgi:alanyl-tRNA synthetase